MSYTAYILYESNAAKNYMDNAKDLLTKMSLHVQMLRMKRTNRMQFQSSKVIGRLLPVALIMICIKEIRTRQYTTL